VAVGVRMAKTARVIRAPLIISACGARTTHTSLIPLAHRLPLALAAFAPPDGVGQPPLVSTAHFVLFVALDTDGAELPSRNYWVTPTSDHDANVRAHREDSSAGFPAVFISFPSRKDPDYQRRYPGKSTASIIAAADYGPFKEWSTERVKKRGAEYEALKHNVATRMLAHLFELHPELENKIDFWELGTPLSTQHYIGAVTGESYGLAATPDRFHQNAITSVQTGVRCWGVRRFPCLFGRRLLTPSFRHCAGTRTSASWR
jgi:all-trans-retinol 13,14-reductase